MVESTLDSDPQRPDRDETLALATFFSQLSYDDLPEDVISHAKACILNALGCALGSANAEPHRKAFAALISENSTINGADGATILGHSQRTDVNTAAFLNGIAITTADYDDTHLQTVIHPSGAALAAILAWAESHHVSGKEVILAFVVAVEIQCAVGNAISPSHYANGWHITGTTGTFGAAGGVAKLMRLPPKQFAAALGHSASMASGIRAMFGTDTKTLHMGRGAQNGILAASLARSDFSSCPAPIEAWARLVSSTVNESLLSAKARGGPWQILENTFKPYPCGIVIHPLIDGCLEVCNSLTSNERDSDVATSQGQKIDLDNISDIRVVVNPQCVRLCNVRHPRSGLETIFSLYHGCAVALVYGRAGPAEFSDNIAKDPIVARVREIIQVETDDEVHDDEAFLYFKWNDSPLEKRIHISHATGSLAKPMSRHQLETKFLEQAIKCMDVNEAHSAIQACWEIDSFEDISEFVRLFIC
ncbi:mmge/prpd family protein-like protein [Xylogone sp. PMI_703]|nr:mmge/prpd family protein-like protein [Xylogone sp. PMI_703]